MGHRTLESYGFEDYIGAAAGWQLADHSLPDQRGGRGAYGEANLEKNLEIVFLKTSCSHGYTQSKLPRK